MAYYDTIRDPSTFLLRARGKPNFEALFQDKSWKGAASLWGREHLFASRVLCSAQSARLPIFQALQLFPDGTNALHPCLQRLIEGPGNLMDLAHLSEPQIVQQHEPDSLGYVWAALACFVKHEKASAVGGHDAASAPTTPKRQSRKPELYGSYVQSHQAQFGSSSPDYQQRPPSSESDGSVGYVTKLEAPLLEDATVRLASCFIRCVLNYAQPIDKESPFVHFRDERLAYSYASLQNKAARVYAIDDGGLQILDTDGTAIQVAIIESKRAFKKIVNGAPVVPDELLAQMVGETLALRRDAIQENFSDNDFFTILATSHYMKFFHFDISNLYLANYESLSTADLSNQACFLRVNSTV